MTYQQRTQIINRLQARHPGTFRMRYAAHGTSDYAVEFFRRDTGEFVAAYNTGTNGTLGRAVGKGVDRSRLRVNPGTPREIRYA